MFKRTPSEKICVSAFLVKGARGIAVPHVCNRDKGHPGLHTAFLGGGYAVAWNDEGENWWSGSRIGVKEHPGRMRSEEPIWLNMANKDAVEIPLSKRDAEITAELLGELPHTSLRKADEQN